MEKGEGSNQRQDLHESVLDVMPISVIFPPTSVNAAQHHIDMVAPFTLFSTSNNAYAGATCASPRIGVPHTPLFLAPQETILTPHGQPMLPPYTSIATSSSVAAAMDPRPGPSNGPVIRNLGQPRGSETKRRRIPSHTNSTNFSSTPQGSSGKKSYQNSIISIPNFQGGISERDRETGNAELVSSLLMRFDAIRRRLSQTRHGDISKALGTFKNLKLHTNFDKRIGSVPGVEVGDIFFCWGEMYLVGLHVATIGIEFMKIHEDGKANSVAISVISSGKNVDVSKDPDSLIYPGYGGTEKYGDGVLSDQLLERMNLTLHNAFHKKTALRVVRAVEDQWRNKSSVYVYDGLYLVTREWMEKEANNCFVYKFKLVREPGQKPAFKLWKNIEEWKSGSIPRPRTIIEDVSNGAEVLKIPLVNELDDEKGTIDFIYVTTLSHWVETVMLRQCTCRRQCGRVDGNCLCAERNEGSLPYTDKVLVARKPMIYECGSSCCCSAKCKNRVIQNGLKYNFEVFKTTECGWGLRSWNPIHAGSFICEYAGEVIKNGEEKDDDDFIFDSSRVYNYLQWNYEPELVGEKRYDDDQVSEELLMISAKKIGNVSRFMNHSCEPNVLWQPMKREYNGMLYIHIGMFAVKHVSPMTELRFDYGVSREEGKKVCMCGSNFCRGFFG